MDSHKESRSPATGSNGSLLSPSPSQKLTAEHGMSQYFGTHHMALHSYTGDHHNNHQRPHRGHSFRSSNHDHEHRALISAEPNIPSDGRPPKDPHSPPNEVELVELTDANLMLSGRKPSNSHMKDGSVTSSKSKGTFYNVSTRPSIKRTRTRQMLGVDIVDEAAPGTKVDDDEDSDAESSEDVLVGAADDDDDEDEHPLPWFVPEVYSIALPNAQQRIFELDTVQRIFVALTDTSSWFVHCICIL
jgi:hypothetical protein